MDDSKQKIALFIDADNAPASKFEDVLSEVAKYGVVTIRKAYGNWKKTSIKAWEDLLHVGTKGQVLQSCICVDRVCLWLDQ